LKSYYDLDGEEEEEQESKTEDMRNEDSEVSEGESSAYESEVEDIDAEGERIGQEIDVAQQQIQYGDATNRIALVNLQWDKLRAVDLFVLLHSFLPSGGILSHITIHPSDFGLKMMEEENRLGPQGIWNEQEKDASDEADGSHPEKNHEDSDDFQEPQEDEAFDPDKLRQYEIQRMRYYYAIAVFDSVATAAHVYFECDGMEFEASGNILDLRYVPDSESFENRAIHDRADELPRLYEAPDFTSEALQHSKVQLSWDGDDYHRKKLFRRKLSEEELAKLDFDNYLASDGESDAVGSDFVEEIPDIGNDERSVPLKRSARSKFSSILSSISKEGLVTNGVEEEGQNQDISIVFETGLKNLGTEILERKKQKQLEGTETVFAKQQRKLHEKKLSKKKQRSNDTESEKAGVEEDHYGDLPSDFEEDPFFKDAFAGGEYIDSENKSLEKTKKQKKRSLTPEEEDVQRKSQAELELLMMDDVKEGAISGSAHDAFEHGYDLAELIREHKEQKSGKVSKSRKRKRIEQEKAVDHFHLDSQDTRFAAVFDNPEFSIDPTDKNFKSTKEMDSLLVKIQEERSKSREEREKKLSEIKRSSRLASEENKASESNDSLGVQVLVHRLKSKCAAKKPRVAQ